MVNKKLLLAFLSLVMLVACKKDPSGGENYSSTADFLSKNAPSMQTFTINGAKGGNFTTPQGTIVTIPDSAFQNNMADIAIGDIKVEFKDLYNPSDMVLSGIPTVTSDGQLLKSGGEFFIRVSADGEGLYLVPGKKITVQLKGDPADRDTAMKAYVNSPDTTAATNSFKGWQLSKDDSIYIMPNFYMMKLYSMNNPPVKGTWSNCDNPQFFNKYNQVHFTSICDNAFDGLDVYLVFKQVHSTVHIYQDQSEFPYFTAPKGLQCTIVAFGVKDGSLYSAFTPATITDNGKIHFTLQKTTSEDFLSALKALDK